MAAAAAAPNKTNGVLAVHPSQANSGGGGRSGRRKAAVVGKKVVVRRLAPGMTQDEFWAALGDEWKGGQGKVDWTRWESGKISKDPFKPSKPSRCYLRILKLEDVPVLSDIVRGKTWEDSKNTWNDACLAGPVYVEVAQIQKVAASKRRTDPRQGTIDQDPDFVAFLESLDKAQSTTKESKESDELAAEDAPKEAKVTITPLVQYLKEKKAAKAKEAANAKSAKHGRQEPTGSKSKAQEDASKKKGKDAKNDRSDGKEKSKEPVKLLTKKAAQQEAAEAAKAAAASKSTAESKNSEPREEPTPKSRRAGIAAAAKILQRDLGLSPGSAHRRARQDAAKTEVSTNAEPAKATKDHKEASSASTSSLAKPNTAATVAVSSSRDAEAIPSTAKPQAAESNRRSRGKGGKQSAPGADGTKGKDVASTAAKSTATPPTPVILKREDNAKQVASVTPPTVSAAPPSASSSQAAPSGSGKGNNAKGSKGKDQPSQKKNTAASVSIGSRGFVKHANPSQGITEAALKQAMEVYGSVTFVEIDKRKSFAYIDFAAQDSLAKAMAASPIKVAQGAVHVLERKDNKKPTTPATSSTQVASASTATPAAATQQAAATPAPADGPVTTEKVAPEKPATDGQSDRPKRGGRGRGRKGGGGGGNAASGGGNGTSKNEPSGSKGAPTQTAASARGGQSTG